MWLSCILTPCSCWGAGACLCICWCSTPTFNLWVNLLYFFVPSPRTVPVWDSYALPLQGYIAEPLLLQCLQPPPRRSWCLGGYMHSRPECVGKFCYVFILEENFGVQFCLRAAPHSGRGEWPQHTMCSGPLYCLFAYFLLRTLRRFFTYVCTCAHLRMCLLHCMHAGSFALTF